MLNMVYRYYTSMSKLWPCVLCLSRESRFRGHRTCCPDPCAKDSKRGEQTTRTNKRTFYVYRTFSNRVSPPRSISLSISHHVSKFPFVAPLFQTCCLYQRKNLDPRSFRKMKSLQSTRPVREGRAGKCSKTGFQ